MFSRLITNQYWQLSSLSSLLPPPRPPASFTPLEDGTRTVHHSHGGHPHRETREPARLQDRDLRLEEALPLPVCSSLARHPCCEPRSHHLDSEGDVVFSSEFCLFLSTLQICWIIALIVRGETLPVFLRIFVAYWHCFLTHCKLQCADFFGGGLLHYIFH